ncbi:MAG: hypothetical protein E7268_09885 [Lachnospiraceae bacterium]|nr:hypothetical protein [Lachnospiraceae bacterium]
MEILFGVKTDAPDLKVEYEVYSPVDMRNLTDSKRKEIALAIQSLDDQIAICDKEIDKLNGKIDNLTNHADKFDYTLSVASGVLTGLIDAFFVGELNLQECHDWGSDKVNEFVKKVGGSDNLDKAIENLEKKSKPFFASDPNLNDFGGGKQHHFRDFAHHPTLVGLTFSLLTQFSGNCYGTDTIGKFIVVPVKDKSRIGNTVTKKIIYGTVYWFLHLVSDMAGTRSTAGGGTGLPGPILSFAKELSALPFFQNVKIGDMQLSVFLSKIFNGTLFAQRDANGKIIKETVVPIDLRTELGIIHKQAFPVILNELIVRVFYTVRRFSMEVKEKSVSSLADFKRIEWKRIIPIGNRTVERMITIASGTFMAVDMADAAIRSAAKSAGNPVGFWSNFILRVNFVGIGRFAIAIVTDVGMGARKGTLQNKRMEVLGEKITLLNSKVFYRSAEIYYNEKDMYEEQETMWLSAEDTVRTVSEAYEVASESMQFCQISIRGIYEDLEKISEYIMAVEEKNPVLMRDVKNILKWGKK